MVRRSARPRRAPPRGRKDWLEAAARALADEGPGSLQVEPLARRLGVTKGSFYWHFADRQALVDALVDDWRRLGTSSIIDETDAAGGTAADRLRRLWERTSTDEGLGFELGLRDLARRDPKVAEAVADVDGRRLAYLRSLFRQMGTSPADAEARAMLCYSLLVGNHFLAPRHGRFSRQRVLRDAIDILLDAPAAASE